MATTSVFILLLAVLAVSAHDESEFTGDGIIGHAHSNDERQDVVIHIIANTAGFVGFGIAPKGVMDGADMFIGGCSTGVANYSGVSQWKI